jgi:hypothetical protein
VNLPIKRIWLIIKFILCVASAVALRRVWLEWRLTFLLSEEEGENTSTWRGAGLAQAITAYDYVRSSWSPSEDTSIVDVVSYLSTLRFLVASIASSPLVSSICGSSSVLSLLSSAGCPSSVVSRSSWSPSGWVGFGSRWVCYKFSGVVPVAVVNVPSYSLR